MSYDPGDFDSLSPDPDTPHHEHRTHLHGQHGSAMFTSLAFVINRIGRA